MGADKMNIYLDNIIYFLQRSGGGSVYWTELVKRFQPLDAAFIEPGKSTNNIFRKDLVLQNIMLEKNIPLGVLRYLPLSLKIAPPAIFHSSYYRISLQKGVSNIVTVHDFTYEYFLKGFRQQVHSMQKKFAATRARGIICISENTKKDLIRYMPAVDRKKIKVIYNGVNDIYRKVSVTEKDVAQNMVPLLQKKNILYVGHRSTYKNFNLAVDTVKGLGKDYTLTIVGGPLNQEEEKLLRTSLPDQYIFLGNVSDADLNLAYNLAFCLLYPSSYEGFGIPLLEAMKAHCPVITTNLSSIPEVVGTAAQMVSEPTTGKFITAIRSLEDDMIRREMIAAGQEQALKFSWDKCFNEVQDFYHTTVHSN